MGLFSFSGFAEDGEKKLHYLQNMWRMRTISYFSQSLAPQNLVSEAVFVFASWPLQSVNVSRCDSMNKWWVSDSLQSYFGLLFFIIIIFKNLFIYITPSSRSLMKKLHMIWPSTDPWDTLTSALWVQLFSQFLIHPTVCSSSLYFDTFITMNL